MELVMKGVLVLLVWVLRFKNYPLLTTSSVSLRETQALICFILLAAITIIRTIVRPYRVKSTNLVMIILDWCVCASFFASSSDILPFVLCRWFIHSQHNTTQHNRTTAFNYFMGWLVALEMKGALLVASDLSVELLVMNTIGPGLIVLLILLSIVLGKTSASSCCLTLLATLSNPMQCNMM